MYGIVLAGGAGSRLWPLSRVQTPKQLLSLSSERTLLQETVRRLCMVMPAENIVVVTSSRYVQTTREQIPDVPGSNVLAEPEARGTAPAIGLGLLHIQRLAAAAGEADPVIGSFHADHFVEDDGQFARVVEAAAAAAERGPIVTLGVTPHTPHTGYGYIQRGAILFGVDDLPFYAVERFVEKPDHATAEEYLRAGVFYWNSGIFIWQLSTILAEFEAHQPRLHQQLARIGALMGSDDSLESIADIWAEIETQSIDVGIAEQSRRMSVVPADFGWSDVGDWATLRTVLAAANTEENDNVVVGGFLGLDTTNCLIHNLSADRLVVTLGVDNLVIVDTGDVVLVCDQSRNQEVKKLVDMLKERQLGRFL